MIPRVDHGARTRQRLQTKMGKLHILGPGGLKTVCGIKLGMEHWADPISKGPWVGPDKCHRCQRVLESEESAESEEEADGRAEADQEA